MDRLLFVDDEPFVLKALKRTFELEGYEVVTATRPAEALDILSAGHQFVVIGSDYRMPEMDGAKFLQHAREITPQSYRLLISAVEEFQAAVDAVNRGEIFRFIPKPWNHGDLLQIVKSAVDEYHLRRNYQEMTTLLHSKNADLETLNLSLEHRVHERTRNLIDGLVSALDQRGSEQTHSRKVAAWSLRLGQQMGLDKEALSTVEQAALIHDVGKIGIPDSILGKRSPLTPEEWEQMKRHPELGYRLLAGIPYLEEARKIVIQHHERWDGKGYPFAFRGEEIHPGARILHVAEAYEAITNPRAFRDPRSPHAARAEILRCCETQFDPAAVDAFAAISPEEWEAAGRAAVPASGAAEATLAEIRKLVLPLG
jgi:response regulator RpfG family c-di-GMP phosphodiesterase